MKPIEMAGLRFGNLTVLHMMPDRNKGRSVMWLCRCDCGNESVKEGYLVRAGFTRSCGCIQAGYRKLGIPSRTHGKKHSPEYRIWSGMIARCENQKTISFSRYGGAGISVCERWHRFENFLEDMGCRPTPSHSIDRWPDKQGNYQPGNCRWATREEQQNNKRTNLILEQNGISQTAQQWARQVGIRSATIRRRIQTLGWSIQEALTTPAREFKNIPANKFEELSQMLARKERGR